MKTYLFGVTLCHRRGRMTGLRGTVSYVYENIPFWGNALPQERENDRFRRHSVTCIGKHTFLG
jgi:hypothetical protein